MVFKLIKIILIIKENFIKEKKMEQDIIIGEMVALIKVIGLIINQMDMEFINLKMVLIIKDNGKIIG